MNQPDFYPVRSYPTPPIVIGGIRHFRRGCDSDPAKTWRHVWGAVFCNKCWPSTDPLAVLEMPAQMLDLGEELRRHEVFMGDFTRDDFLTELQAPDNLECWNRGRSQCQPPSGGKPGDVQAENREN